MAIFVNGEEVKFTLEELAAKGFELIEGGYKPLEKPGFPVNQEMIAAATAAHWFSERHREWAESNEDGDTRKIRNETRENAARLRVRRTVPFSEIYET